MKPGGRCVYAGFADCGGVDISLFNIEWVRLEAQRWMTRMGVLTGF